MYRSVYSREEWDEIVNNDFDSDDTVPHCNPNTFHLLGTCPFCDSYYRQHPSFRPVLYSPPEANGWGGNQAPRCDDEDAEQERNEWDQYVSEIVAGTYEHEEKKRVARLVERIVNEFRRPKK